MMLGPAQTFYFGQVEECFGIFGNSIDTGNIAANISGSNCDHNPV